MGVGKTFGEAMLKSQLGAGSRLPTKGTAVITVKNSDKARAVVVARDLVALGFAVVATKGTAAAIAAAGIPVKVVNKVKDGRPHIADMIKAGEIQLVFTTVDETRTAIADSRYIRTAALANRVTYYTTMAGAEAATEAIKHQSGLQVVSVRVWLRLRGEQPEPQIDDNRTYRYADVEYTPVGDERRFRRMLVSRTITLRNSRTL
jgi:carbamoyl-phosphate synthase large subunit